MNCFIRAARHHLPFTAFTAFTVRKPRNVHTFANESNMAKAKFCANISFMFKEHPFLERYDRAKAAGFKAVESGFPFGIELEEVKAAKEAAGIEQILINTYTGDVTKGQMGFAAIPGSENEFKKSIELTVKYAKAVGASKIHVMAGIVENPTLANDLCYAENLRYAVDVFQREDIMGVIEPINNHTVPHYYLNNYEKAFSIVKSINNRHLRIMVDLFHMQIIRGNITKGLHEMSNYIGHVQIAQVPHRKEPSTAGEMDCKYVLDQISENGYRDWIGLEYTPANDTVAGLNWIQKFNYSL